MKIHDLEQAATIHTNRSKGLEDVAAHKAAHPFRIHNTGSIAQQEVIILSEQYGILGHRLEAAKERLSVQRILREIQILEKGGVEGWLAAGHQYSRMPVHQAPPHPPRPIGRNMENTRRVLSDIADEDFI